jgi:hypothetical protein
VVGDQSGNPTPSQMLIDATKFPLAGDMCAQIAAACAKLGTSGYPAGATIDARGFTGNKVCSASTATTMLNGCVTGTNHNGGKLLLGNVNLYIDGPIPPATSYTDGSSGVGTPAIIIPSMFWGIEGISRGATASGTNAGLGTFISPCPTTNPPTGCNPTTHPFPQRSFGISTNTVSGNTMTILLSTSPPSGSFYPAELVMVKGSGTLSENGTYKLQSFSGSVLTVTVPSTTGNCSGGCGTLILGTPILGFANTSNPYNDATCFTGLCSGFGEHIHNLGFNCQQLDGCIGWQNLYCQEECGADTFLVSYYTFVGVDIHGGPKNGTQNFGPVLNAEIYTGKGNTACGAGTTGLYVGDSQMRGLNGWTINNSSESSGNAPACNNTPTAAVLFDAPNTEVINGHCEGFLNCILMGANNAPGSPSGSIGASSQKVSAVAGGPACPSMATCNVVHISNNYQKNSDYVIQNIRRNQFSNNIKDDVNGVSVGNATAGNDPFTALYSWASGVNNTPPTTITNMLTTDPSTPNQFGGGVKAATYGTVSNCASASGSCGSATAGRVAIAPAASTVTVSTTAVTAKQRDQGPVRRATLGSGNLHDGDLFGGRGLLGIGAITGRQFYDQNQCCSDWDGVGVLEFCRDQLMVPFGPRLSAWPIFRRSCTRPHRSFRLPVHGFVYGSRVRIASGQNALAASMLWPRRFLWLC